MKKKPKIGLALSGGSGRAIAHIGVLEVFEENNIPIDILTSCSSGSIVAASYACGTLPELKKRLLKLSRGELFGFLEFARDSSGLFSLKKAEEAIREYTLGKKVEEVRPVLSFVVCDIETGEPVNLYWGDLAKLCRVSCSVPGLFPPVQWGNRILVDGGIFTMVPVDQARQTGADLVIGVDIAATRYILDEKYMRFWDMYEFLDKKGILWPFKKLSNFIKLTYHKLLKNIYYNQADFVDELALTPNRNLLSVMLSSIEIGSKQRRNSVVPACEVMLSPQVKQLGIMDMDSSAMAYEEGRRVAEEAVPEIKKLIRDFELRERSRSQAKRQANPKIRESDLA